MHELNIEPNLIHVVQITRVYRSAGLAYRSAEVSLYHHWMRTRCDKNRWICVYFPDESKNKLNYIYKCQMSVKFMIIRALV
jgi:hypothetical protein